MNKLICKRWEDMYKHLLLTPQYITVMRKCVFLKACSIHLPLPFPLYLTLSHFLLILTLTLLLI